MIEIKWVINDLDSRTAFGHDNLDGDFIKLMFSIKPELSYDTFKISHKFNLICGNKIYPSYRKIAKVVLIYIEGKDKSESSNYTRICLLPILGKTS